MKLRFKKHIIFILTFVMFVPFSALAGENNSYIYDDYGKSVPAPAAFYVSEVLLGNDLKVGNFSKPQDLFVDSSGNLYIADTGNNRIVVLDSNYKMIRTISQISSPDGNNSFNEPTGIFVTNNGLVYICDSQNGRVIAVDEDDKVVRCLEKPESELLDDDVQYTPVKLAVDSSNAVYIIAPGFYQGLISFDDADVFTGFFGGNTVEPTLDVIITMFWKKLFSNKAQEAMIRLIPIEYSNLVTDSKDFIFAATLFNEQSLDEVKKLNALGKNVLRTASFNALYPKNNFGDIETNRVKGETVDSKIIDLCIEENGIITLLDSQRGHLFQYDEDSNLLFVFGNKGETSGTFSSPSAVVKFNGRYLVLDKEKANITIFEETDYAKSVKQAILLYNSGEYDKALVLWQNVLKQNNALSLAKKNIGLIYLQKKEYKTALTYLKQGNDRLGYSLALKAYRNEAVRKNFIWILLLLAVSLFFINKLYVILRKRLGFKIKSKKVVFK